MSTCWNVAVWKRGEGAARRMRFGPVSLRDGVTHYSTAHSRRIATGLDAWQAGWLRHASCNVNPSRHLAVAFPVGLLLGNARIIHRRLHIALNIDGT